MRSLTHVASQTLALSPPHTAVPHAAGTHVDPGAPVEAHFPALAHAPRAARDAFDVRAGSAEPEAAWARAFPGREGFGRPTAIHRGGRFGADQEEEKFGFPTVDRPFGWWLGVSRSVPVNNVA